MSYNQRINPKNFYRTKNDYLTYHEKLNNEIESIPETKKKFFIQSLEKYKFDLDIYIPQGNKSNRKVYPDKDYLLNKIVYHDNIVNKHREKIDTISKDFTKFFKYYNHLKDNNLRQKYYMNNLLTLYKEKNKNSENLEFTKDENIFNKSILLEPKNLEGDNNIDIDKYKDKNILNNDKNLLLSLDKCIKKTRSPNSMANIPQQNVENFITSINRSYFINNNKDENKNNELKGSDIIIKKNRLLKTQRELSESNAFKEENKKEEKHISYSNKETKKKRNNNTLDKYLINSNLLKINKIDTKKRESKTFLLNKDNTNINIITNQNNTQGEKNDMERNRLNNIRKTLLKRYNKEEYVNNTINKNNIYTIDKENKYYKNNRYLLTSLNKVNISKKLNEISEIKKEDNKYINNNETNNNKSVKNSILKKNLPNISQIKNNSNKSINIKKAEINQDQIIKAKHKSIIKESSNNSIKKAKEKMINKLYSTISIKSNYINDYPYLKVKNYFKKYKNIIIKKIQPEKGINIYPLLENIEETVKDKDVFKLAKSLEDTKKYLSLGTENNLININDDYKDIEKSKTAFLDKISENENKFPLIKYDCAEKIIFGEGVEK